MATIRKHNNKWQSIVRVVGYPQRTQSFTMKSDAVAWSKQVELDIQRDLHNAYTSCYYVLIMKTSG